MNIAFSRTSSGSSALVAACILVAASAVGCGSTDESPFAKTPGAAPTATTPTPGTTPPGPETPAADAGSDGATTPLGTPIGGIGCGHDPARYVVLGHSVAHCFAVNGVNSETCSLKSTHTRMAAKFPGLTYENYAVDGAVINGVVTGQLPKIPAGDGHVFVNLFIGGNDLAAHMYEPDATAQKSWDTLRPKATADLETIITSFDDKTKFPKGATIMINSQYNPFDECVAGQYAFVTNLKQSFIRAFNDDLNKLAQKYKNVAVVDQYTTFLGHGHNYNQAQCPKYVAGDEYWMSDLIHPNAKGHENLAHEMESVVNLIYTCK